MNLFYIKNPFSVLLSTEIISLKRLSNNVALIHNFDLNDSSNYQKKIVNGLITNPFGKIYFERASNIKKPIELPLLKYISNRIYIKKTFYAMANQYEELINFKRVQSIFLSNVAIRDSELALYFLAKKYNIKVSLFDEGMFHEYTRKHLFTDRKRNFITNLLLNALSSIVFYNNKLLLNSSNFYELSKKEKFHNYYTLYPWLFPYNTIPNIIKLEGSCIKDKIKEIETPIAIFLSRPMSEDGILDLHNEIFTIKQLIENLNHEIYIKFHPRDSAAKKEALIKIFSGRVLSPDLMNVPAEYLINSPNLKFVYGFNSNALFFISSFSNIKCFSLLNMLPDDRINKSGLIIYSNDFPNIIFLK